MSDWLDKLTPQERQDWEAMVRHYRTETLEAMTNSSFMLSMVPPGKPDIKYCVELGMAIMLDKPILALATPGAPIPEHLRRVADEVVELTEDPDTETGQMQIVAAIKRIVGEPS